MCVYSMVSDHFAPMFPNILPFSPYNFPQTPEPKVDWATIFAEAQNGAELKELREAVESARKLIAEFKEALEAAKVVDRATKQPDCADPEKAKLEERVAAIEKILSDLTGAQLGTKRRRGNRALGEAKVRGHK